MFRKFTAVALIALSSACLLAVVRAEDEPRQSSRRGFGSRMEQFKQELLGEKDDTDGGTGKKSQGRAPTGAQQGQPTPAKRMNQPTPAAKTAESEDEAPTPPAQPPKLINKVEPTPTPASTSPTAALPSSRRGTQRVPVQPPRSVASSDEEENDSNDSSEPTPAPAPRMARTERAPSPLTPRGRAESDREERGGAAAGAEAVLSSSKGATITVEATGARKVMVGKESTFFVKVRNASDVAARNVTVNVQVPEFVDVQSVQPTSGSVQDAAQSGGQGHEWKLARLEAHGRETLSIKIVPRQSQPIELGVQWTSAAESLHASVDVQEPKLSMSISGPSEVTYGQSKVYKLTVSNPGNGDAEHVAISLSPIGRSRDRGAKQTLGLLRGGESKTIDVELTAHEAGELSIKAQATADGGLTADATQQVLVRRAELIVAIRAPKMKFSGTPCDFEVNVSNDGNAPAENVKITAALPADAKYVTSSGGGQISGNGRSVSWVVGGLRPGAAKRFELKCMLASPGDNELAATVVADGNLTVTETATTRVEALADLKLEIKDPQGPLPVGEDAVYEVVIRNRGSKGAEQIDLTLFFSDGMEATKCDGGQHRISSGQVTFQPIASLPAGGEAVCRVHTKASQAGSHIFRAEVNCQPLAIKLAAEQTTRFYGEEPADETNDSPRTARSNDSYEAPAEEAVEEAAADDEAPADEPRRFSPSTEEDDSQ